MNLIKKITLICLPWALVACSSMPVSTPVSEPRERAAQLPANVKPKLPAVSPVVTAPDVVVILQQRAQQQLKNGEQQAAVASLERAIRIAPRYPESYFHLGELRFQQGSYAQARSLSEKALSLGAQGWLRTQVQLLLQQISSVQSL